MRAMVWILAALLMVFAINPVSATFGPLTQSLSSSTSAKPEMPAPGPSRTPQSERHYCTVKLPGYIQATASGTSIQEATEKARQKCGEMYIELQFSRRAPTADEEAELSTRCINLDCE